MTASSSTYDVVAYVGRFQPFHDGHLALLMKALEHGKKVVVALGSAFQARCEKNPFTWKERASMIRVALPEEVRDRVVFEPIRDYYEDEDWVQAVTEAVTRHTGGSRDVALIGHFKDASSYYLNRFQNWNLISCDRLSEIDATTLRRIFFGTEATSPESAFALMSEYMPESVVGYLRGWIQLPYYKALVKEHRKVAADLAAWEGSPYTPIFVTADNVVTCAGKVLLIQRKNAPGEGLYALPGGYIEPDERVYQAALRELREETNFAMLDSLLAPCFCGVKVFDHPGRSARGRIITHAHHFALAGDRVPQVQGGDDASLATWVDIAELAALEDRFFEDHFHILDSFLGLTRRPNT